MRFKDENGAEWEVVEARTAQDLVIRPVKAKPKYSVNLWTKSQNIGISYQDLTEDQARLIKDLITGMMEFLFDNDEFDNFDPRKLELERRIDEVRTSMRENN